MSTPVLDGETNEVGQAHEYRYSLQYWHSPKDTDVYLHTHKEITQTPAAT